MAKLKFTSVIKYNGKSSGFVSENDEFGITFKSKKLKHILGKTHYLIFNSKFYSKKLMSAQIVVSITSNNQIIYSQYYQLSDFIHFKNRWENVNLFFNLPKFNSKDFEVSVYLWNDKRIELFYDDFGFKIF